MAALPKGTAAQLAVARLLDGPPAADEHNRLAREQPKWHATGVFAPSPENLAWTYDLVAPDDVVRRRALARHQAFLAVASQALKWSNSVWAQAGSPAPSEPHLAAEMDQARAAFRWNREQTNFSPINAYLDSRHTDSASRLASAPFLALYLRWEAKYPQEWATQESRMWSPWTTKEVLVRELGRRGVPGEIRPQISDLIVSTLQRPYRCKDWMFARLVRHIADKSFIDKVEALLHAHDPLTRLRAEFILHIARHPHHVVKQATWRRWLSAD